MHVRVDNPEFRRTATFAPSDELVFGRHARDVGQLAENTLVSRRHGLIEVTENGFTVTSIGSYSGFVVRDQTTPSRLHIPSGVGPVDVPFAEATVAFDHRVPGQLVITVHESARADRWREQWGPEAGNTDTEQPPHGRTTAPGRPLLRKANDEPYAWFRTLVAMCEPELTHKADGAPTNVQLGRRLGHKPNIIERHLQEIYRALEIPYEGRPRDAAVKSALSRGLVTPDDLTRYGLASAP